MVFMDSRYSYTVDESLEGSSVYHVLRERMGVSEAIVRHARRIDEGVWLDGHPSRTDAIVRSGQIVALTLFESGRESSIAPEPGPLAVVYEDADLLIVDKPAGLVVHPSRGHFAGTLCNFVAHYLESTGQRAHPHPVNRLDKDTSGLLAFAKHAHAQNLLQEQLHSASFERTYLAICTGALAPASATIRQPVARLRDEYGSFGVCETGKPAITHYQVLGYLGEREDEAAEGSLSLLELCLETGRTHQIRVHLSHLGHPLLGDDAYGSPSALIGRCALHSWKLSLTHPATRKRLSFTAPPPADLASLVDARLLPA